MKMKIRSGNSTVMRPAQQIVSSCRHCQFYVTEGRRGGHCRQLGVPVQGTWKACSLACAPFLAAWQPASQLRGWQVDPAATSALDLADLAELAFTGALPEIESEVG